jgi:hypothetical protein
LQPRHMLARVIKVLDIFLFNYFIFYFHLWLFNAFILVANLRIFSSDMVIDFLITLQFNPKFHNF